MINTQPEVNPEGYYELKATAAALGVTKNSVLRWTNDGKMTSSVRCANNRRIWKGSEIVRFWKAQL